MNKTIKVIDLLNKIANGEEVPKKIRWRDKIWDYWDGDQDYKSKQGRWFTSNLNDIRTREFVTDTVEIIEDKEDINIQDIEELELYGKDDKGNTYPRYTMDEEEFIMKINEIIKAVNQAVKQLDKTNEDK